MLKRQKKSAKFKKDYVAFLAIGLFLMVICAEITLSIWLPMEMRSADAWAEQVARQRMIDNFDKARRLYIKGLRKNKVDAAIVEMQIAKKTLDQNARFLRAHQSEISRDQVHSLSEDYRMFFKQCRRYFDPDLANSFYCSRKKLNATEVVKHLSTQLKVENKK
jgi:hypothetical protein